RWLYGVLIPRPAKFISWFPPARARSTPWPRGTRSGTPAAEPSPDRYSRGSPTRGRKWGCRTPAGPGPATAELLGSGPTGGGPWRGTASQRRRPLGRERPALSAVGRPPGPNLQHGTKPPRTPGGRRTRPRRPGESSPPGGRGRRGLSPRRAPAPP